jgi:hypothetical protein
MRLAIEAGETPYCGRVAPYPVNLPEPGREQVAMLSKQEQGEVMDPRLNSRRPRPSEGVRVMRHVASLALGLMLLLVGPGADGQDTKPAKTDIEKEAAAWGYPNAKVMSAATAAA